MSQVYKRIAVKIGSNVLTRKDGALDITRMSALVDQVAELRRAGVEVILISSGAVASGRGELKGMPVRRMDKNYVTTDETTYAELLLALLQFDMRAFVQAWKNIPAIFMRVTAIRTLQTEL